jgi:hypothetical protein
MDPSASWIAKEATSKRLAGSMLLQDGRRPASLCAGLRWRNRPHRCGHIGHLARALPIVGLIPPFLS